MQEYFIITGRKLSPLDPEPRLSDFYKISEDQQTRDLIFMAVALSATGLLAYNLLY